MVTQKQKSYLWNNAKKVRGKNPNLYRRDVYGNQLFKPSYGKDSAQGWQIDHIKPKSRGGSDTTRNLQPLQSKKNRSLGNSLSKRSRHTTYRF